MNAVKMTAMVLIAAGVLGLAYGKMFPRPPLVAIAAIATAFWKRGTYAAFRRSQVARDSLFSLDLVAIGQAHRGSFARARQP